MKNLLTSKVFFLLVIIFGPETMQLNAQKIPKIITDEYQTAIGIRMGETSGLTIKQLISNTTKAVEVIIGFSYPNAFSATLLFENNFPVGETERLNWYCGAGLHMAIIRTSGRYQYNPEINGYYYQRNGNFGIGADGIWGIEYKLQKIPFIMSFDIKPFLEFNSERRIFFAFDPGLGFKFSF